MPCCHAPISAPVVVPEVRIGCGKAVCHVSILQLCGRTTTDLHVPWGSLNLNSCEAFKEWRENERESHTHTQKRASLGEPIRNIKGFNKHGKLLGKRKHTNKSSTDTSASMQTFHTFQRIKRFTRHQVPHTSLAFVHAIFTAQPLEGEGGYERYQDAGSFHQHRMASDLFMAAKWKNMLIRRKKPAMTLNGGTQKGP